MITIGFEKGDRYFDPLIFLLGFLLDLENRNIWNSPLTKGHNLCCRRDEENLQRPVTGYKSRKLPINLTPVVAVGSVELS